MDVMDANEFAEVDISEAEFDEMLVEARTVTWHTGPRAQVDLNDRTREDALTRARLEDVIGQIAVGEHITVYEPEDGVAADAVVREIDTAKGLVFLAVDWASLRDDEAPTAATMGSLGRLTDRHPVPPK